MVCALLCGSVDDLHQRLCASEIEGDCQKIKLQSILFEASISDAAISVEPFPAPEYILNRRPNGLDQLVSDFLPVREIMVLVTLVHYPVFGATLFQGVAAGLLFIGLIRIHSFFIAAYQAVSDA